MMIMIIIIIIELELHQFDSGKQKQSEVIPSPPFLITKKPSDSEEEILVSNNRYFIE